MKNSSKEITNVSEVGLATKQWEAIGATTPSEFIKKRPGRGGKVFSYVETGYVIDLLNKTFNGMWEFTIEDQSVGQGQVWVRGRLTVKFPIFDKEVNVQLVESVSKTQYGGSDIKKEKSTGASVDIADDLKAAGSDALKKCASLFGFAADIYWAKGIGEQSQVSPSNAKRNWIVQLVKSGKIKSDIDPRVMTDAEIDEAFKNYKQEIGK